LLALVRQLAQVVDVVAVELQYTETYTPFPTAAQVADFRELRAALRGAGHGVQSHVPQAQEPYGVGDQGGSGLISYGLGNLFFDQMWSWETWTELAARRYGLWRPAAQHRASDLGFGGFCPATVGHSGGEACRDFEPHFCCGAGPLICLDKRVPGTEWPSQKSA
jgi:hypothetical protein